MALTLVVTLVIDALFVTLGIDEGRRSCCDVYSSRGDSRAAGVFSSPRQCAVAMIRGRRRRCRREYGRISVQQHQRVLRSCAAAARAETLGPLRTCSVCCDNRQLRRWRRDQAVPTVSGSEKVRLRSLRIEWHVENMPRDALVPPLVLQPLGTRCITASSRQLAGSHRDQHFLAPRRVHCPAILPLLRQPRRQQDGDGQHLERLALHFDAEASPKAAPARTATVHIRCRTARRRRGGCACLRRR
jgi:hypothetical protein